MQIYFRDRWLRPVSGFNLLCYYYVVFVISFQYYYMYTKKKLRATNDHENKVTLKLIRLIYGSIYACIHSRCTFVLLPLQNYVNDGPVEGSSRWSMNVIEGAWRDVDNDRNCEDREIYRCPGLKQDKGNVRSIDSAQNLFEFTVLTTCLSLRNRIWSIDPIALVYSYCS